MKIEHGPGQDCTRIIPTDDRATVHLEGLNVDETRACFLPGERSAPWAVSRQVLLSLPVDRAQEPGPTIVRDRSDAPEDRQGDQWHFDDGRVFLETSGSSRVEVDDTHREPELPMPRCLMLALAHQWARLRRMSLHAAAVHVDGRSLLVLGESCAGKSTLALSALTIGGKILSDDWVLAHIEDQELIVTPLRERMLVRSGAATEALLGRMPGHVQPRAAHASKAWLDYPTNDHRIASTTCDAVLYLRPTDDRPERTRLDAITPVRRYAAVMDSTSGALFSPRLPAESSSQHTLVQHIVRTPGFFLTGGHDLVEQPRRAWDNIVQQLSA